MGETKKVGKNKKGRFTKNNNFSQGKATLYREEYCEELIKYVSDPPTKVIYETKRNNAGMVIQKIPKIVAAGYPSFKGFAAKVGVTEKTLLEWAEKHENFGKAYELAKDMQAHLLLQNGLNRQYDPGFARFVLEACHGVTAKVTNVHEFEGSDGFALNISIREPEENNEEPEH